MWACTSRDVAHYDSVIPRAMWACTSRDVAHYDRVILRAGIGGGASLASERLLSFLILDFFFCLECDDDALVFEEEGGGGQRDGEEQKAESCRAVGEAAGVCRLLFHVCMYISMEGRELQRRARGVCLLPL
jgi:hypothetical protein